MGLLEQQTPAQAAPGSVPAATSRTPEAVPTPVNRNIAPGSAPPAAQPQPQAAQPQDPRQEGQMDMGVLNKYVKNAVKIIHSPKVSDNIIDTINKAPDKVDAVGEMSVEVANRLNDSADQAQVPFDESIMAHGLNAIVGEVASIADAAGVAKLTDEHKYQAYSWALSNGIDKAVKTGQMSPDRLKQLGKKSAQHLQKMQQQGGAPAPEAGM